LSCLTTFYPFPLEAVNPMLLAPFGQTTRIDEDNHLQNGLVFARVGYVSSTILFRGFGFVSPCHCSWCFFKFNFA